MVADRACCDGRQGLAALPSCTGVPVLTARLTMPERLMNAFAAFGVQVTQHSVARHDTT